MLDKELGSTLHIAGISVKGASETEKKLNAGHPLTVIVYPLLLSGRAEAYEQHVGTAFVNLFDDRVRLFAFLFEVSVVCSDENASGELLLHLIRRRFGDAGLSAEEENLQPLVTRCRNNALARVKARNSLL